MPSRTDEYDAVVIGGGPAGCATATVLAQKGRRALLLERDDFPRYHIGESLVPYTYFSLERLGVLPQMRQSAFPRKYSVQFVSVTGQASQPFYFYKTIKHPCAVTWQVLRSDFDQMLLDNARAHGVDVRQGAAVREVLMEGGRAVGVRAELRGGAGSVTFRARCVADASGRATLLAGRQGWKRRDPLLNKISIFTYFKGAKRDPGLDAAATTVAYIDRKGWFWYIPLPNDVVSVGIVADAGHLYRAGRDPQVVFDREAAGCRWIREHIEGARQIDTIRVTSEFSYNSSVIAGDGFCLVGDAFAFLDPVFSSGVFLALKGGEMAADAIDAALATGDVKETNFTEYENQVRFGLDSFRKLVLKFYDHEFSFGQFIRAHPELHPPLVDILVGNVYKDLQPLFDAMESFARDGAPMEAAAREPVSEGKV